MSYSNGSDTFRLPDFGVNLPDLARATYAVRYITLAFSILILYDHFITLDTEIQRIWPLKWRLPKVLFMINRYIASPLIVFIGVAPCFPRMSLAVCNAWDHSSIQTAATIIAVGTAELILIPRVAALYGNNKMVYIALIFLFLAELGTVLAVMTLVHGPKNNPIPELSLILDGCFSLGSTVVYQLWIPPVVFESVVIIFTLQKWFQLALYTAPGSSTLRLLVRDSLIYFILMFASLLANMIVDRYSQWYMRSLLLGPSSSIACIAAARMMMNLQSLAYAQYTVDLSTENELRILRRTEWACEVSTLHARAGTEENTTYADVTEGREREGHGGTGIADEHGHPKLGWAMETNIGVVAARRGGRMV
ncbi:hypothetical protein PLICRDRAFT_45740 [Plicaturopsis crispa FD-325 SS-3]|uniref:Unplaced genomic scaffold PLICRscaffold_16, whole genome shotgun sequence n=1 Tax=Plicaturopsis crispa FD-325 SS-3 TaxID=944288 RepID=A0A0C9SY99_PLICR|nr:hypothetical protein PLICRDRAFT_45740 [Plicaturopsis crispa FD-325 SS-3]